MEIRSLWLVFGKLTIKHFVIPDYLFTIKTLEHFFRTTKRDWFRFHLIKYLKVLIHTLKRRKWVRNNRRKKNTQRHTHKHRQCEKNYDSYRIIHIWENEFYFAELEKLHSHKLNLCDQTTAIDWICKRFVSIAKTLFLCIAHSSLSLLSSLYFARTYNTHRIPSHTQPYSTIENID